MINKRGQGLSTNAIVLIVLAVIVLVLLVVGFTVGWSKFAPWLSGNNVDTIVNQCNIACSKESTYDYCTFSRKLNAEELDESVEGSCSMFSNIFPEFGIDTCSKIVCPIDISEEPGLNNNEQTNSDRKSISYISQELGINIDDESSVEQLCKTELPIYSENSYFDIGVAKLHDDISPSELENCHGLFTNNGGSEEDWSKFSGALTNPKFDIGFQKAQHLAEKKDDLFMVKYIKDELQYESDETILAFWAGFESAWREDYGFDAARGHFLTLYSWAIG